MNESMNSATPDPWSSTAASASARHLDLDIPALRALGDQIELAAAKVALEHEARPPVRWSAVLAPTLVVLAMVMGLSVKLTPSAEAMVLRAADRTAATPTGRFTMSTRVVPGLGSAGADAGPIDLSTDGVYDASSNRLRTTVDLRGVMGAATPGASLPDLDSPVETIEDGSTIYLKAPVFERVLPEHKPWVKVDVAKLDPTSPVSAAANLDGTVTDPSSFLQALRGIGDDTRVVERTDVDGVSTLHYRGTVDLERAASRLPADDRARLLDGFVRLGVDPGTLRLPMDVWVDDDGAVRRVSTELRIADDASNDASLQGATVTVTVAYRDLGVPERIVLPSAEDVTDITPMVNTMLTGPLARN